MMKRLLSYFKPIQSAKDRVATAVSSRIPQRLVMASDILIGASAIVLAAEWYNREVYGTKVSDQMLSKVGWLAVLYGRVYLELPMEPEETKLLPDLPANTPARKTLVLSLANNLFDVDRVSEANKSGEVVAKERLVTRPGFREFLSRMSQLYEIVLFDETSETLAETTAKTLDPEGKVIAGAFGFKHLSYRLCGRVKDMRYLNRPLDRMVIVEVRPAGLRLQRNNAVFLPKFDKKMQGDTALIELLPFLEYLARDDVDIKSELEKWGHWDTAKHWAAAQKAPVPAAS